MPGQLLGLLLWLILPVITNILSHLISLFCSDIFIEFTSRLLSQNPSRWATFHRKLLEHLSVHSDENLQVYRETCLEIVGGMGRQLAKGIKSLDPLKVAKTSGNWIGSFGPSKDSRKDIGSADLSITTEISHIDDDSKLESIYFGLLKDSVASICLFSVNNGRMLSFLAEAAVQVILTKAIVKFVSCFTSPILFLAASACLIYHLENMLI